MSEVVAGDAVAMGKVGDVKKEKGKTETPEVKKDKEDAEEAPLEKLPEPVQKRLRALRKNQMKIINLETDFYKEMQELEIKYEKLYQGIFKERDTFISGAVEPSEDQSDYPLGPVDDIPRIPELYGLGDENKNVTGIPMFWATVLQSVLPISAMIEDHDLPILKHLTDIRYENTMDPLGFRIFFYFSPNEFFGDTVLTKTYLMKNNPDPEAPLTYDGPEIISCKGCPIDWKSGKDVTACTIEKRQKHKRTGTIRTVTKSVKQNSFFLFFSPPVADFGTENEDEEDDVIDTLNTDFEIGQSLRERIIPRAVLYFTGEALDDETDYGSETEEGSETGETNESTEEVDIEEAVAAAAAQQ